MLLPDPRSEGGTWVALIHLDRIIETSHDARRVFPVVAPVDVEGHRKTVADVLYTVDVVRRVEEHQALIKTAPDRLEWGQHDYMRHSRLARAWVQAVTRSGAGGTTSVMVPSATS